MIPVHSLDTLKQRKQLLDDVWLLTIFAVLLSVALPWFHRILDVSLAPLAWSAFGFGLFYLLISFAAERASKRLSFLLLLALLQIGGVFALGLFWRLSGGLQNPGLLIVFVLPVMAGSALCVKWHSYATSAAAVLFVGSVCLLDYPGLRWYVAQLGLPAPLISPFLASVPASTVHPFPGLSMPPSYIAVLIFVFAVMMFLAAFVAESVGGVVERLQQRLSAVSDSLSNAESLSTEVLRQSLWPSALIFADTFQFAQVSRSLLQQYFIEPDSLANRSLFDVVTFSYPDVVEGLIAGAGGEIPHAVCSIQGETRVTRVQVSRIDHAGVKYAYVSIQDITDYHYLRLAIDALEEPVVVVNLNGRLQCFNHAAKSVLQSLELGQSATESLRASNVPFAWWDPKLANRAPRQVQLNGRMFSARCASARVVGESEALTIIRLHANGDS